MKKKSYNENYFEKIDSEDKAYFLGLICADGCVINDPKKYRYKLNLKLHNKDYHIIESLIHFVGGEMNVWKNKKRDICEVSFSGKKIVEDLENLGICQNKTFHLVYPVLREDLERHFLRGYFDGDGCIRINFDKRDNSKRGDLRIVGGSVEMMQSINERMSYLFNIKKNILYGPKNKKYKFIGWAAMSDIEKIYKGFYEDTNLFLHRKKTIFNEVIDVIQHKQKYRKK